MTWGFAREIGKPAMPTPASAAESNASPLFRCGLSEEQVRRHLPQGQPWRCDDLGFFIGTVSSESLEPARAARLRLTPTRLTLPRDEVDFVMAAGRDAARRNPALMEYVADQHARP